MESTRAEKRIQADIRNPLCEASIVERVLSYGGPGHWWFVATLCSLWEGIYSRVADVQMSKVKIKQFNNEHNKEFVCSADDSIQLCRCIAIKSEAST
jgi:hypothetical protein